MRLCYEQQLKFNCAPIKNTMKMLLVTFLVFLFVAIFLNGHADAGDGDDKILKEQLSVVHYVSSHALDQRKEYEHLELNKIMDRGINAVHQHIVYEYSQYVDDKKRGDRTAKDFASEFLRLIVAIPNFVQDPELLFMVTQLRKVINNNLPIEPKAIEYTDSMSNLMLDRLCIPWILLSSEAGQLRDMVMEEIKIDKDFRNHMLTKNPQNKPLVELSEEIDVYGGVSDDEDKVNTFNTKMKPIFRESHLNPALKKFLHNLNPDHSIHPIDTPRIGRYVNGALAQQHFEEGIDKSIEQIKKAFEGKVAEVERAKRKENERDQQQRSKEIEIEEERKKQIELEDLFTDFGPKL